MQSGKRVADVGGGAGLADLPAVLLFVICLLFAVCCLRCELAQQNVGHTASTKLRHSRMARWFPIW